VEEEVIGRNPALRLHKSTDARQVVVTFAHAQVQALVTLTLGSVPASTAAAAPHIIAGPWVFPLPVG
jgi:hypothetical protein